MRFANGAKRGVVIQFNSKDYDPEISDFVKIGSGSLGGKARGLAFVANLLRNSPKLQERYPDVTIQIPQTLVITTEGFDSFVSHNGLDPSNMAGYTTDDEIAALFLEAQMPSWLTDQLGQYLSAIHTPLSIRSSGLLEDAHHHPIAGLYKTYMVPNNHPDFNVRHNQLVTAIKLVYASTWFKDPLRFLQGTAYRIRRDQMAVIVQRLVGSRHNDFFYPDISGIAQSHNDYPVAPMKTRDGVANIVLGFGRGIPEGEPSLRFSPTYPKVLPQFSKIEDILANAQNQFWALAMEGLPDDLFFGRGVNVEKRHVADAEGEGPIRRLASTFIPEENRIRDTTALTGSRIITFASILKYDGFPLPGLLKDLLKLGREGLGCAVEFEFSVNMTGNDNDKGTFNILQVRPMAGGGKIHEVSVTESDRRDALCYTAEVLGHGLFQTMADIVFVRPDTFDPKKTVAIAQHITAINHKLVREKRPYLLMGHGRWGSFDPWLGIPVKWKDINGVGAMVEIRNRLLKADPSHGTHFFHNITANGIPYLTVTEDNGGFIAWDRLLALPIVHMGVHLGHIRLDHPLIVKCDVHQSQAVIRIKKP